MKDKNGNVQPPYLGAAYYPEDWPEEAVSYTHLWREPAGLCGSNDGILTMKTMRKELFNGQK